MAAYFDIPFVVNIQVFEFKAGERQVFVFYLSERNCMSTFLFFIL